MKSLLIIDPQNDFCDSLYSALPVLGACKDLNRLSNFIENEELDNIIVTLDTHKIIDISHPKFWIDNNNINPNPFTIITAKDIIENKWVPYKEELINYCIEYAKKLEKDNKNNIIIWPEHCIEGTWGWQVYGNLKDSLNKWELKNNKPVTYIKKGMNPLTEHYSAIKAEVELDDDPLTKTNEQLLSLIKESKKLFVGGQALTHCVYLTLKDIIENLKENKIDLDIFLLENTTSPVSGFEGKVDKIISDLINNKVNILNI